MHSYSIITASLYVKDSEWSLTRAKNKEKVQFGNPKSGRSRLQELFIAKFKLQFRWGFAKVVVTRAGCLREWPQGEL